MNTDYAISGELGLEMIENRRKKNCCREYKLVFLDLEMPGMNGYQTYAEIHRLNVESRVVACSGHSSEKEKEKTALMGIADYLEKPLKKEEVQAIV